MANLTLDSVGKSYGSVNVLRDINLEFDDGEFVVLVGPSGCGKSTLLRMIAGLETVSEGDISIDGMVMNHLEARERDIAMVFQSYALYPHFTVAQNIGFPLRIRNISKEEIDSSVKRVAAMTGLTDLLERKPAALSGGQRQRVAMGRAIIRSPKVFLFDEPLSNLDAKLRVQMRLQIRDLHREVGATSVYVTHDQVEAMTLADRVVLLDGGDVQQVGTPLQLYEHPANTFVAGFIGSPEMNLIPASIRKTDVHCSVDLGDDNTIQVPGAYARVLEDGQEITFGIRPEDLQPAESGFAATLKDTESLGSETHVFARMGDTLITSVSPGIYTEKIGSTIRVSPDLSKLHFFDIDTGLRINPETELTKAASA